MEFLDEVGKDFLQGVGDALESLGIGRLGRQGGTTGGGQDRPGQETDDDGLATHDSRAHSKPS